MIEPRIERIKTEVYFTDAAGVEWQVRDTWPGWRFSQYPGAERAGSREFRRWQRVQGARPPELLELRRYDFEPDDTRWFVADVWQLQLDLSEVR